MNQSVNHLPEQVLTMSPVYTEGVGVGQNLIKMKRVMMEILTGVSTWHQY